MHKKLPARPNLEHLRSQAKALLTAFKSGDPQAIQDFADHYAGHLPDTVRLTDAQLIVARKNGFRSWPKLAHYVEQLRALEGTWLFTSLEVEGAGMPEPAFSSSRLLINGDRFRVESREANYEGIFDIDVEVTPHTIDIDFVEGPEAGHSSYGIYEFAGNDLKICLGLTGYPRPSDFRTTPGSGHALETLRRGKMDDRAAASPAFEFSDQQGAPASREGFDVMTPELELLQGKWAATSLTQDGMALPPQFYEMGRRVAQGNVTTVTFGDQVWMRALTRIDASQEPQAIDYLHLDGSSAGQIQQGILSLAPDEMQTCLAAPGTPRPKTFTSTPGSGFTLSTWRRKR